MNNIEAVIFDMDGVLIDSELHWIRMEAELWKRLDVNFTQKAKKEIVGLKLKDISDYIIKNLNPDITKDVIYKSYFELAKEVYLEMSNLMPGAKEILRYVKQRGYLAGLCTSSPVDWIDMALGRFEIRNMFDRIFSTESMGLPGKPDPAIYNLAIKSFNISAENTFIIEDSHNGYESAIASGAHVIAVPDERWNSGDYSKADLIAKGLDDPRIKEILKL